MELAGVDALTFLKTLPLHAVPQNTPRTDEIPLNSSVAVNQTRIASRPDQSSVYPAHRHQAVSRYGFRQLRRRAKGGTSDHV